MQRRADPPHWPLLVTALASATLLAACGGKARLQNDEPPTLRALAGRQVQLDLDQPLRSNEDQALAAWREVLAANPPASQRAQALRRLGDLEMDRSDSRAVAEGGPATPDYRAAIQGYQDYLKAYPKDPDNHRVLYQLARAEELGGNLDPALAVLDRLVSQYPDTPYLDEAQFRRGELLFTARRYPAAEQAYSTVLASPRDNPYTERALYMQGWSRFKQGHLEPALTSFLTVLDHQLAGRDDQVPLAELSDLSRANRELVEDSFRVVSLALENLGGAATLPDWVKTPERQAYEVRLYQQLAGLYTRQERPKDAADTLNAFVQRHPQHPLAPALQAEVIAIYNKAGFGQLALQAQKDFVARYAPGSAFAKAQPTAWQATAPQVKTWLTELAQRYHAASQRSHQAVDVQEAVRWYSALLNAFPDDADAAGSRFLLAELLFEDKQFAQAAAQYEQVAYGKPVHARSADAGYAALLAHAELVKLAPADQMVAERRAGVASALRFADGFAQDPRATAVLSNTAETQYQLGLPDEAASLAQRVLAAKPPAQTAATPAQQRVALTVLGNAAFEAGRFAQAEQYSQQLLALTAEGDKGRGALEERLAAAIYKQGEQAREAGQGRAAAELFARVGSAAPQSAVRVNAQFDAATELLTLKDWAGATRLLEDFRQRFPGHPLQAQVPVKLALAYTEQAQWVPAAAEFERISLAQTDPQRARAALWQAAELQDKAVAQAGASSPTTTTTTATAQRLWASYLKRYPEPLAPALEARATLARLALAQGQAAPALNWQRELLQAEQAGGDQRTARTRTLGAQAALAVAAPVQQAYQQVALVEPLQKQLKLKKARLEDALKAYALAADYGVAEVVTAATFQTAALYQDFGKALIGSQRPKKLSKLELEQYDVLLEEQAFPFEEKAIALHELNAKRTAEGLYDTWVQQSFAALRTLRPARFAKTEKVDSAAAAGSAADLTRQGVSERVQGHFSLAKQAYERALALDPAHANAAYNLGILYDLYLGDKAQAQAQFEHYLALTPAGDPQVAKWLIELKNRKEAS
jgi:tetratricopeptide (TPR) repeat protein